LTGSLARITGNLNKEENSVILSEASANVAPPLAQQRIQERVEEPGLSELPRATSRMAPAFLSLPGKKPRFAKLLTVALLIFLTPIAQPQRPGPPAGSPAGVEDTPTFHVKVHLVNVFVNVTDSTGAPIGGLTQNDFALTEDGVAQKITYFDRETNLPLNLVLAIDTSGSVRKDLDIETRAARDFMRVTLRPKDGLDLIDFNSSVREVVPFTADLHHLDWGLNNLDFGPATALYDAIYLSAQSLAPRSGRKVLVVISDGGNTVNNVDFQQALDQAIRDEVMVYSLIDIPIPNDAGRDTGGEHALITLSQETGGKYFYAEYGDVAAAFRKISEDLRTQYLIGYYPVQRRTQTDFRRIQLTLTPSAPKSSSPYTLRYRPGYYATASAPLDQ
jgi:Ca-activated chloride channel family protein